MGVFQAVELYILKKMKTLTLLIFGFLLFPMSLSAQSVDVLLQKVSEALSAGKDDYAVSLFRQAAGAGTEQTEMYYWTCGGSPFCAGTGCLLQGQAEL